MRDAAALVGLGLAFVAAMLAIEWLAYGIALAKGMLRSVRPPWRK